MMRVAGRSNYRWAILALSFLVLLTSFSIRLALANVAVLLGKELSLSATAVGTFVTAFYLGYVIANAVGGFVADRIGASRAISSALVGLAVCTFAFGSIDGAFSGLAVQCAMGLTAGVYYSATTKLVGEWFSRNERGRAFGVIAMPSSLAVIVANAVFPLVAAGFSWQVLYRFLGGYVAIVAAVCVVFLKDAPRAPEDDRETAAPKSIAASALRDRNFLLLALGGFCGNWATWGFAFWANALMVKGHGLTNVEAGRITAIFGLGAVVAKPLYGLLSDLLPVPRKYLVVVCYAAFAVMLIVFGMAETSSLALIAPFLGVSAFVYSPIQSALLTELVGQGRIGSSAGMMNAFWQTGSVLVPIAVGAVFQLSGSFVLAFMVLAAGPAAGTVCMLALREPRSAERPSPSVNARAS